MSEWWLSIDPASRSAGASLWKDGKYIASITLTSDKKRWTDRMRQMTHQLSGFTDEHAAGKDLNVLIETTQHVKVRMSSGALTIAEHISSDVESISPSTWKKWLRDNGIKHEKGRAALECVLGYAGIAAKVESDDEADSILMFLARSAKCSKT